MLALYECQKDGYSTTQLINFGQYFHFKYYGDFYYDMFYPPLPPNLVQVPPDYDLSKVTVDITLHRAIGDSGSNAQDIALLKSRIPGRVRCDHIIADPNFTHQDFPCGIESAELVFNRIADYYENGICPN